MKAQRKKISNSSRIDPEGIVNFSITAATPSLSNVSSDEEFGITQLILTDDNIKSDHKRKTDETIPEYLKPNESNLKVGNFDLGKVKFGRQNATTYICLELIKSVVEACIAVTGLKSIGSTKHTFKLVKGDVFDVLAEHCSCVEMSKH